MHTPQLDEQFSGGFNVQTDGTVSIFLQKEATNYTWFHEYSHAHHYFSLPAGERKELWDALRSSGGRAYYEGRYVKELYVWDQLRQNASLYALSDAELRHADRYLISLRSYVTNEFQIQTRIGAMNAMNQIGIRNAMEKLNEKYPSLSLSSLYNALEESFEIPDERLYEMARADKYGVEFE